MKIALWIIAICELIRIIQNASQLLAIRSEKLARDRIYAEIHKGIIELENDQPVTVSPYKSVVEQCARYCSHCKHVTTSWKKEPCCSCGPENKFSNFEKEENNDEQC